ncbi:TPA: hypothetical protein HA338_13590 [Methanosarcina acetivorans]|uniref:Uncharacterized protein n=1 Tax=Methanosarcina acetivorans TaxID=2214 RepID=A0A832SFY3_9EURY|nr:hypothetical protein [Methanosarcina acetivorans]HIH94996.1 hypothetical protein [Methanosarcina acetivorans]
MAWLEKISYIKLFKRLEKIVSKIGARRSRKGKKKNSSESLSFTILVLYLAGFGLTCQPDEVTN